MDLWVLEMLQCSGRELRSQARLDAQHTFLTANMTSGQEDSALQK